MPTLRQLDEEITAISTATKKLSQETAATSKQLEEQARRILYLTDGSRSGNVAAQAVSESARSTSAAVSEMDRLASVCDSYVVMHGNA